MKKNAGAFNRAESMISTIIRKIGGINKPGTKFLQHILILFMGIRGRYNFLNMSRYGSYSEQSYRNNFEKGFNFFEFNIELIRQSCSSHCVIAFDPSYIPKSGKKTDHLGRFWSGTSGKTLKGLEIGGIALIDIENNTSMSLEAIQTPANKELKDQGISVVDHYAQLIVERSAALVGLSNYLAVDGYFAKQGFIETITGQTTLQVISKLRGDANLMYLHRGEQPSQRGRPKKYAGKVAIKSIDKRRIKLCYENDTTKAYSGLVWSVGLKREVKIAYIEYWKDGAYTGQYAVLFSTDLELEGQLIYQYYKGRFQIEFLYRDAKQHCGLNDCQGRSESKLHYHFNASLTTVSLAKAIHYLPIKKEQRQAFSMSNIKTLNTNKIVVDRIFSNLALDLNCKKIKTIYRQALFFGCLVA